MLELEPAKRYSAEQCLADPWVRRYQEKATITVPIMKTVIENMKTFRVNVKLIIVSIKTSISSVYVHSKLSNHQRGKK